MTVTLEMVEAFAVFAVIVGIAVIWIVLKH